MTPTQRSLAELRRRGYTAQVVERWNSFAKIRQDLFGFIDIVAIQEGQNGVLAVQATSTPNMSARLEKARGTPALRVWLASGNRFLVWGWAKRGARGERKLFQLKEHEELPNRGEGDKIGLTD